MEESVSTNCVGARHPILTIIIRAIVLKEAAACKIQKATPISCLALFQNVLYKGYTLPGAGFYFSKGGIHQDQL